MMTPKERVEISLRGGLSDVVPFTIYEHKLPQCAVEREMRNRGTCIVNRNFNGYKIHTPNVKVKQELYFADGKQFTRTEYETPAGTLSTLSEAAGFTVWNHEKMFKGPDDYKALLALIQDEQYEPDYATFAQAEASFGDDVILRPSLGLEPLQSMISGIYMDMQTFCMEWMDNRDEILKLYDALVENRRKIYPIVAQSPALHANYGGNVTVQIIGMENYERYYIQHYNEAAEIMHKHGKLIGSHYDANNKALAPFIAKTDLDYIEAFTPSPDTDMTLAEARDAWPDKVLWLNFPSSEHLKSDAAVEQKTVDLLNELESIDGIIMGITEDIPEHRWRDSCPAILSGLERHATQNRHLYRL